MDRGFGLPYGGKPRKVQGRFKGIDLPAKRVASDRNIQPAQCLLGVAVPVLGRIGDLVGEQDHAGAAAIHGQPCGYAITQRIAQAKDPGQLVDGGRFAAGQDQAVHGSQFGRAPDAGHRRAARLNRPGVFAHVALQGQNAYQRLFAGGG